MTRLLAVLALALTVAGCDMPPGKPMGKGGVYRYDDPDYAVTCWTLDTNNFAGGISCIANPPVREK